MTCCYQYPTKVYDLIHDLFLLMLKVISFDDHINHKLQLKLYILKMTITGILVTTHNDTFGNIISSVWYH